jgi:hypothetical protein
MLTAMNSQPMADAKTLIVLDATPNVVVEWSVESGSGTISGLSLSTDDSGRAYALYDPSGLSGPATIRATYGS